MAISKDTLKSDIWQTIYNLLKVIPDPKSRAIQWWFSAYPDTATWPSGIDYFPIGIVESPDINSNRIVFSRDSSRYVISIPIYVYSTRAQTTDELADLVIKKLRTEQVSLEGVGLNKFDFDRTAVTDLVINDQRAHECRIDVKFEMVK